jgi:hypothetical protein
MTPAITKPNAALLKKYEVSKGTIRFPMTAPPSAALVRRLVKARIALLKVVT